MRKLLVTLCSIFLLVEPVCAQIQSKEKAVVDFSIDGWGNDTIIVVKYVFGADDEVVDTLMARKGKIHLEYRASDTTELRVCAKKSTIKRSDGFFTICYAASVSLVVTADQQIYVDGTLRGYKLQYTVRGSELGRVMADFHTKNIDLWAGADSANYWIENIGPLKLSTKTVDSIFARRNTLINRRQQSEAAYVLENPNRIAAAYYFNRLSDEDALRIEKSMSPEFRNGIFKAKIDNHISRILKRKAMQESESKVAQGRTAPDFALPSIDGSTKRLSDFRGKWVVLDFWGSWCGWCIKGFAEMKKSYEKHVGRFEIIGIACRDKDDKWRTAVNDNKLPWVQLFNGSSDPKQDVSVTYAVKGYPTKIIIDPQGVIRATVIGEDPQFYSKLDELFGQ